MFGRKKNESEALRWPAPLDPDDHTAHGASGLAAGAPGGAAPSAAATTDPQADDDGGATGPRTGARPAKAPVPTRPDEPAFDGRVDLTATLGTLELPNPVLTASGCAANGPELGRFFDLTDIGAFVTKTVLAEPRSGRGTPRMAETGSGMVNSIGLQGPGIAAFLERDLPWLAATGARIMPSIAGNDPREFGVVAKQLTDSGALASCVGIEVNISCPNVANRGLVFACDPASTTEVLDRVRAQVPDSVPLFAKLTPDVTDIVAIARAAVQAGADGLTMINTTLGLVIDTDRLRPHLAGVTGGLSGPAIRPIAVRAVWQVYAAMLAGALPRRPIIGVGGVTSGEDAMQFFAAGASAVQVGTAIFNDPHAPVRIRDEIVEELTRHRISRLADVIGVAHTRLP